MMKRRLWNSRSGNRKGFILSLDAAIAILMLFIFISVSAYYVSKASEDHLARLQMIRSGSDVINILDQENVFESFDQPYISDEMAALLPPVYEMRLRINGTFPEKILTVETTNQTPEGQFIVSGEKVVVLYDDANYYGTVKYWMWLK